MRRSSSGSSIEGGPVTLGGLLSAARRWWPVTLIALMITGLAAVLTMHAPGRYEASAAYVLLPPASNARSNALLYPSANLITAAGVLSEAISDPQVVQNFRANGVTDHYAAVLHNEGNQNADNFDRPVIDLFVYGSDPVSVQRSMTSLVAGIDRELLRRQQTMRTRPTDRIRSDLTPRHPPVVHGTGSPLRAAAATTLVGIGVTTTLVIVLDDLRVRRRHVANPAREPVAAGVWPS
jgi:hypothetical protein